MRDYSLVKAVKAAAENYVVSDGFMYLDTIWKYGMGAEKEGLIVLDTIPEKIYEDLKGNGFMVAKESERNLVDLLYHQDGNVRKLKPGQAEALMDVVFPFRDMLESATLVKHNEVVCFTYVCKDSSSLHIEELEENVLKVGLPIVHGNDFIQQLLDENKLSSRAS